jgi:hypothetical protein
MNREFEILSRKIENASCPEDVFGEINTRNKTGLPILKRKYRAYAKISHPDLYLKDEEKYLAHSVFKNLKSWMSRAEARIKAGRYGTKKPTIYLRTPRREYAVENSHVRDEIYNLYTCHYTEGSQTSNAELKVVHDARDNELANNEMRALRILGSQADAEKISPYIPKLLDAFFYEASSTRKALILKANESWYSLEDVREVYPDGIASKDMAWIWRRLLVILGYAHRSGILHGGVLPRNIWIFPEEHGLMLTNWTSALIDPDTMGRRMPVFYQKYQEWYPQDYLRKEGSLFPADILMSAKNMIWLLGGDPHKKIFPKSVPTALQAFLSGCILPLNRSPRDAWALLEEFDELLETLWGPRKFHPFHM